jgi:predicted phage terminase large subunit-like protein
MSINQQRLLAASLRTDLAAFVEHFFPTITGERAFVPGFHIEALCYHLEQCFERKIKRIAVNIPPRCGKSICASVAWPAWALGQDPALKFACISYGQELAHEHAEGTRRIMMSDQYQRLFPSTRLSTVRPAVDDLKTTRRGRRLARSMGGPLTGFGADFIVIDDGMRADDAYSPKERETMKRAFDNTIVTRLNDPNEGVIAIVMQRLHIDDLTAHAIADGGWTLLDIPAIATERRTYLLKGHKFIREPGDVIQPDRFTMEFLDLQKRRMGSARFEAQYQQRPYPEEGNLIKREWFPTYNQHDLPKFDGIVQSWDPAAGESMTSGYSACLTFGVHGQNYYLLDAYRGRLDFGKLKRKVSSHREHWGAQTTLMEFSSAGASLWQVFREESRLNGTKQLIGVPVKGSKIARMERRLAMIEAGQVLLPAEAPWLNTFLEEVLSFPGGAHTDQVDALSQFLKCISRNPAYGWGDSPRTKTRRKSDPNGTTARAGRLFARQRRRIYSLNDYCDLAGKWKL